MESEKQKILADIEKRKIRKIEHLQNEATESSAKSRI